jgi:hypothetical protein
MNNKRIRLSAMEIFVLLVIAASLIASFFQARREERAEHHRPQGS